MTTAFFATYFSKGLESQELSASELKIVQTLAQSLADGSGTAGASGHASEANPWAHTWSRS
jgi:hypothetical protein